MQHKQFIEQVWEESIIPTLKDYIHIPNKSPLFDPQWETNGHMNRAVDLATDWCKKQNIKDMYLEVVRLHNRTPVIFIEIPGDSPETILLYGHLDKQPEMSGWDSDLGPWKPVLKDDKLYGRGGADDGYAIFASLTAIAALQKQQIPHARCVILIECCEESGSYDLPFYMDALADRIMNPNLVICLDSGCGNYDQFWLTTSLRGLVNGSLYINVLKEGVHSGNASGIVPSCFMILRQLLERIEDKTDSKILLQDLQVEIPAARLTQAKLAASVLQKTLHESYPFVPGAKAVTPDTFEQILNRTWRSALSITGADGLPELQDAGNVTLPHLTMKLSMRLPPTCDAEKAAAALKKTLESNPPFDARIQFELDSATSGWDSPELSDWLVTSVNNASTAYFGKKAMYMGEGGSIPFMGMLGKQFPKAQFVITGLLGPGSNAHGPNEFLHIPTGKKLTCCIAEIIADHYKHS
ncbi:MAG: M20 family metallopeptidase [Gammaproteobacteria bacterium]|nr:M20 family metallopeptidase [Gammaproteobacteria bacterium]